METVVFLILAIVSVIAAFGVVASRNIVHSAFLLALTMVGVAGLYILLSAHFLAAVQILIYAGAVSIMVVFAVMLTLRGDVKKSNLEHSKWHWGVLVSGLLFGVIALVILGFNDWSILPASMPDTDNTADIARLMLARYMIPFEIAAFMITMALVGAVILAKGVRESK